MNKNEEDFALLVGKALQEGYIYNLDVTEKELQQIVYRGRAESFMFKHSTVLHFFRGNRSYCVLRYNNPLFESGEWCVYGDES